MGGYIGHTCLSAPPRACWPPASTCLGLMQAARWVDADDAGRLHRELACDTGEVARVERGKLDSR